MTGIGNRQWIRSAALALTLGLALGSTSRAQPVGLCAFDDAKLSFAGDAVAQATCLLRRVEPYARVGAQTPLPTNLASLVGSPTTLTRAQVAGLVATVPAAGALVADLARPMSRARSNAPGAPAARYFVIHDTSTPNLGAVPSFPADIDGSDLVNSFSPYASGEASKAHVFVNRRGELAVRRDFSIPWRATKLELRQANSPLKGLFVHIELVQPRRNDARGIDAVAPSPGFTSVQYERLALLYLVASVRAGQWMIPGFHAVVDSGLSDGHDDPQNFDLALFDQALASLLSRAAAAAPAAGAAVSDAAVRPVPGAVLPLRASLYYTALQADYPSGSDAALRTRNGELIVRVSAEFARKAAIEGSAKLSDGRLVNVDGKVNGETRWRVVAQAYGLDARGCGLVPFRSAAVDRNVVPLRTKLFLPETVGMPLPGGGGHDGVWYAVDTGSAIVGDRIDLFVGAGKASMDVPRTHGIGHLQSLKAEVRGQVSGCTP